MTPRRLLALFYALIVCVGLAPLNAVADDSAWVLDKDIGGIAIYTRLPPGGHFKDFKGTMVVDAPVKQIVATLADASAMPKWFFWLKEARFIKGPSANETYIYMAINGVWPTSPRDVVAQVNVRQDPDTKIIRVDVVSREGLLPPQAGYVRMPNMTSSWTLRPLSATRTAIEVEGHGEPGGWIPTSLANMVVATVPRQSMEKMRQYVTQARYGVDDTLYAQSSLLRDWGKKLVFPES
jgi:hypothetical protein